METQPPWLNPQALTELAPVSSIIVEPELELNTITREEPSTWNRSKNNNLDHVVKYKYVHVDKVF